MTRVLLADDQELVRAGFRLILELEGFDVVGEAADGAEALEQARQLEPDVVLMDVRMPRMDGTEATRRIGQAGLKTRVLVLTTFDMDEHVYDALRAGASGFLLKDAGRERLVEGVRTVAAGAVAVRAERAPAARRPLRRASAAGPRHGPGGPLRTRAGGACVSSAAGSRTPRSARRCSSRWPRSRPTCATCWPSWACATACRPSCWPTNRARLARRRFPRITVG